MILDQSQKHQRQQVQQKTQKISAVLQGQEKPVVLGIPYTGNIVLTFDIEVEMNTGLPNVEKADNSITSIAAHDSATGDYFVYVLGDTKLNKAIGGAEVNIYNNERDLLWAFLQKWQEINPTIVTGWNIDFFDIPYLYNRLKKVLGHKNANSLSPIGKVDYLKNRERYVIAGVSCLDYLALYKTYTYQEFPNYRLDTISKLELGRGKVQYTGDFTNSPFLCILDNI